MDVKHNPMPVGRKRSIEIGSWMRHQRPCISAVRYGQEKVRVRCRETRERDSISRLCNAGTDQINANRIAKAMRVSPQYSQCRAPGIRLNSNGPEAFARSQHGWLNRLTIMVQPPGSSSLPGNRELTSAFCLKSEVPNSHLAFLAFQSVEYPYRTTSSTNLCQAGIGAITKRNGVVRRMSAPPRGRSPGECASGIANQT